MVVATIQRALLSCYDKSGLEVFAKALEALGVELVASGGTAQYLQQHGLSVQTIDAFAGITEQLDGRVKTLHPKIHAGILALRDHPAHMAMVDAKTLIDLVVVNLYPFEQTIRQPDVTLEEALECIDIGGVALLRAAAKNFTHVAAVCQPRQYPQVIEALQQGHGELSTALTQQLAATVYELTSRYDQWIAGFLGSGEASATEAAVRVRQQHPLRYGENPHQQGAWYVPSAGAAWGLATIQQLQGKGLSYNNLLDVDAGVRCLLDFEDPTCVMIKHNAPCGLASAATPVEAYTKAYACDAESAFGGVVVCNRPIDAALAKPLSEAFLEVVVAPSVESKATEVLSQKPKLRVLTLEWPSHRPAEREWRQLLGGWLLQEPDGLTVDPKALRVVTQRAPSPAERADLLFAWNVAKHVKSNGVVIASDHATRGIGQGQPSRVGAVRLAIEKAGDRAGNAVAASDAFFPFPDGVELLAKAGLKAVIQPGGSRRDAEVVEAANRHQMAMLFTGIRHFRH